MVRLSAYGQMVANISGVEYHVAREVRPWWRPWNRWWIETDLGTRLGPYYSERDACETLRIFYDSWGLTIKGGVAQKRENAR